MRIGRGKMPGMKRPRAFKRDACFGFRLPDDDKRRLFEVARRTRRDPSSLMLEFLVAGLVQVESKLHSQQAGASAMAG